MEMFDAEEAIMHLETPRRTLTFDNGNQLLSQRWTHLIEIY